MPSVTSDVTYKSSHWFAERVTDQPKEHYSPDYCIASSSWTHISVSKGSEEFYADHKAKEHRLRFILDMCYISQVANAANTAWCYNVRMYSCAMFVSFRFGEQSTTPQDPKWCQSLMTSLSWSTNVRYDNVLPVNWRFSSDKWQHMQSACSSFVSKTTRTYPVVSLETVLTLTLVIVTNAGEKYGWLTPDVVCKQRFL